MANWTYGVIREENDFNKYCMRRWKTTARFCESFAKNIAGVYIERIYEKSPTDECYTLYFIMAMQTNKETGFCDTDAIRRKVYEDIRTGRVTLIKV